MSATDERDAKTCAHCRNGHFPEQQFGCDVECVNGVLIDIDVAHDGWPRDVIFPLAPCHPEFGKPKDEQNNDSQERLEEWAFRGSDEPDDDIQETPRVEELRAELSAALSRIKALEAERDAARDILSDLSSWLAAGMGDDKTTPEQFSERIRWGVDHQIGATILRCAAVVEELSKTPNTRWGEIVTAIKALAPEVASHPGLKAAVAAEREACARVALDMQDKVLAHTKLCGDMPLMEAKERAYANVAAAIRARSTLEKGS